MKPDSPQRKENENPDEDDAEKQEEESGVGKNAKIVAVFALIEVLSLVLDEKAEDFSEPARYYVHWLSECGFLAGGAYVAHEIFKTQFWRTICWIFWGITCCALLLTKSPSSTDENGNPIGLLLPANDPIPIKILRARPKWVSDMMAKDEGETNNDASLIIPVSATNEVFIIMGGNYIRLSVQDSIPLIRFHDKNLITLSVNKNGASVSGEFFDRNQNVFAVLSNNEFVLDRQNFWRTVSPDKSTLIITSHQNLEALNIRFCRTNFFKISGIFNFPDGSCAIVTTNYCYYGNYALGGSVVSGSGCLWIRENGPPVFGF
jgi:hypothetical protein